LSNQRRNANRLHAHGRQNRRAEGERRRSATGLDTEVDRFVVRLGVFFAHLDLNHPVYLFSLELEGGSVFGMEYRRHLKSEHNIFAATVLSGLPSSTSFF
jgi:hypothetical protein